MSQQNHATFTLGKTQQAKVKKALKSSTGCVLRLSAKTLKMSAKHGKGFLGDLLRTGGKGAVDFLADKIGLGVRKRKPAAKKRGKGFLGDLLRTGGKGAVDFLADKIGLGVKRKATKKRGKGFLGDLVRTAGKGGVDFLANRVGLGLKKRLKKARGGRGIINTGY